MKRKILIMILCFAASQPLLAQEDGGGDDTMFVPNVKVSKTVVDGDTVQYMEMSNVYVYPEPTFKSQRQQKAYNRLIRNVKKVLPYAKMIKQIIIETGQVLETIPTKKEREAHIDRVAKELQKQYEPVMRKLSYSQGKLLIKLVNRECHSTAYGAITAFMGSLKAGVWQAFAWVFGASLKKGYDPDGVDRLTERVVLMVEAGQL